MTPQRGTVALLGVDERTRDLLSAQMRTGYRFEIFDTHEPLVSALGIGSLNIDALIIGEETDSALDIALTVRKTLRYLQVIILAELREVEAIQRRAEIQSENTDEVTIWPSQHLQALPDIVRKAVKRAHRRVRHDEDSAPRKENGERSGTEPGNHLARLLESAPLGILTLSEAGEVRTLNQQARELIGLDPGNIIGRQVYDFFPVFEQRKLRRLLRHRNEEDDGNGGNDENQVFRVLGEEKRFAEIIVAGPVAQLDEHCTMLILHDVTSIVHAEQAQRRTAAELQASEDRFNELADAMRMIPWEADPKTLRITYIGELVEEVMGYPTSQWLAKNFWVDRLHEDDRKNALETIRRNMRRLQNFDHEFRMHDADHELHWLRNIVNVVRDENGQPARIRGFIVDITEGKSA